MSSASSGVEHSPQRLLTLLFLAIFFSFLFCCFSFVVSSFLTSALFSSATSLLFFNFFVLKLFLLDDSSLLFFCFLGDFLGESTVASLSVSFPESLTFSTAASPSDVSLTSFFLFDCWFLTRNV